MSKRRQKSNRKSNGADIIKNLNPSQISCEGDYRNHVSDFSSLCKEKDHLQKQLNLINNAIRCYQNRFVETMEDGVGFSCAGADRTIYYTRETVPVKSRLSSKHIDQSAHHFIRENPQSREYIEEYTKYIRDSLPVNMVSKLRKRTEKK